MTSHISELRLHSEIIAIILFGSVVQGKAREDSDIDLSIVTRPTIPDSTDWNCSAMDQTE